MNVVLVEPEIPQNTGNIARTCAALGAELHLVHPLGFEVSERSVRRAGLDYWHLLTVHEYADWDDFVHRRDSHELVLFTSRGTTVYTDVKYGENSYLVFGCESRGLSEQILATDRSVSARIPTVTAARCLNLSNAVAVAAYEAARQSGFRDLSLAPASVD
ncbi:MAG: tRNA (cytidine(34)-2'-O)-methyltransferase [Spirochaetota bacterium]